MSCPHGNPIGGCDTCDEVDAAFEAGKRSALAEQPAQRDDWKDRLIAQHEETILWQAKRIAEFTSPPAQRHTPEAMPDDWFPGLDEGTRKDAWRIAKKYPQPAQQEPVALDDISLVCLPHAYPGAAAFAKGWNSALATLAERGPLYTSPPPQRTWVGLTQEERLHFLNEILNYSTGFVAPIDSVICNIEAKLKEKNK